MVDAVQASYIDQLSEYGYKTSTEGRMALGSRVKVYNVDKWFNDISFAGQNCRGKLCSTMNLKSSS
jgi:hypothetical protein